MSPAPDRPDFAVPSPELGPDAATETAVREAESCPAAAETAVPAPESCPAATEPAPSDTAACMRLAHRLMRGRGQARNYERAVELFDVAARAGAVCRARGAI